MAGLMLGFVLTDVGLAVSLLGGVILAASSGWTGIAVGATLQLALVAAYYALGRALARRQAATWPFVIGISVLPLLNLFALVGAFLKASPGATEAAATLLPVAGLLLSGLALLGGYAKRRREFEAAGGHSEVSAS